ncbi:hypothetical protein PanWU01x14_322470 [Parasponia andersonii]|uniref:Uncharacterized protein n=1 Tax=Parasponia andersonii TaxID=3476 RepID=A0A2P5AKZ9_PARAD|nr:hypothetical protein PanWU01x14_322470 [Parasponia andersonii]
MGAHAELSRKNGEYLADINILLVDLSQRQVELRLAVLRDRLANAEKLKIRELQVWLGEQGIRGPRGGGNARPSGDEINILYSADVLKMLDEEKDGPSISASIASEIVATFGLPELAAEVHGGQPGLGALTGRGSGTVVLSSEDSDPDTPPSTEAGPSAEAGSAPLVGGSDIIYDAIPLSAVRLTSGSGSIVHDLEFLVNSPRVMIDKISSGDRDVSSDSSGFEDRKRPLLGANKALPLRCVPLRCSPGGVLSPNSFPVLEVFLKGWQVFVMRPLALHTSSRVVGERRDPVVRFLIRPADKFWLRNSFLFVHFLGPSTSILLHDVIPIVRLFSRAAAKFLLHSSFLFIHLLGSSASDVILAVRFLMRSTSKHFIAQLIPLGTFPRVVDERCDLHSSIFDEICYQAFYCATHSSSYVSSGRW